MARHVEVSILCDMPTGKTGVCGNKVDSETTKFSVNGRNFEIDLCDTHLEKFEEALGDFVLAGNEVKVSKESKAKVRRVIQSRPGTFTTKDVRDWLASEGREVSERGRLPKTVIEEYQAANAS